jgi:dolichol kinase
MRILERLSIQLERYPWAALYRILIGYAVVPLYKALGGSSHDWGVFLFFVAILFGLRVGPMVLRKIMRFSPEAHAAWKYRRYLAKRYDSYQWQKVFWFGAGIGLYVWVSNSFNSAAGILALISLVSGAAGLIFWKKHSAPVEAPSANG